ncbi:hypothetical protein [Streptomyces sp. NPDC054865]
MVSAPLANGRQPAVALPPTVLDDDCAHASHRPHAMSGRIEG